MVFDVRVVSHAPPLHESDPARVARSLAELLGLVNGSGRSSDLCFRMFYEVFLLHPRHHWTVDEMCAVLGVKQTAIYRHLDRLMSLDIVEDLREAAEKGQSHVYRLRYADLSRAWNFAEVHFQQAVKNYRETVNHLTGLLEQHRYEDK